MYNSEYLKSFITEVLRKIGCSDKNSVTVAEVLVTADLRGIQSHGVIRFKDYYELWKNGRINVTPDIKIIHETLSTAAVDGDKGMGPVVANYAMNITIEKAKNAGTCWVAVNNSNHFGIAGYYSMLALKHDMIGIAMTNANPLVAPTFSIDKLLGTNPIAVAIPAGKQPPFVADFATTPIARGKLDLLSKRGLKASTGFVQDKDGHPSSDPDIIKKEGAMLTLGGDREHGSHKGYCMSAIVDIFSAVLSGANFGPFVPPSVAFLPVLEKSVGKGTGHFFGAMRIDAFQKKEDFKMKMDEWIDTFRNAKSAQGQPKVLIPGDIERELYEINLKKGIEILPVVIDDLKEIGKSTGVNFIEEKT
ncbi:MAG: Ldh family oxidoreductase [Bacteroidales bacterium]|jgi:LDH2 family malate/lactate/ureidoglycolate dehydrogenase